MNVHVGVPALYRSGDSRNVGPAAAVSRVGSHDCPLSQSSTFGRERPGEKGDPNWPIDAWGRTVNVGRKDVVCVIGDLQLKLQLAIPISRS